MTTCVKCVMDTSDPNISFDAEGVCNHCLRYAQLVRDQVREGERGRTELSAIVARIKAAGARKAYDCVIGVSGGVDSSYVAWQVKQLGLRPLAVHLDNGWNSEAAISNIMTVLKKMSIDLHTEVLDWEEFKDIQLAFLRASVPDAEVPSDHAIFACLHHAATKFGVTLINGINVRTETHMPMAWSRGHFDFGYIRSVHARFGTRPIKIFPRYSFFDYVSGIGHAPGALQILDYVDYSRTRASAMLRSDFGWRDYGGKHCESLYTRWYQGVYLPTKFGFDKRRSHFSSRICSGEITRALALAELARPTYPPALQEEDTAYVSKKLGLALQAMSEILSATPRSFDDFDSYEKRTARPWAKVLRRGLRVAGRLRGRSSKSV